MTLKIFKINNIKTQTYLHLYLRIIHVAIA